MSVSKKFTHFCGIDIAKEKHVVCVIDRDGSQCIRPTSFANTAEGYQRLIDRLKETGKTVIRPDWHGSNGTLLVQFA